MKLTNRELANLIKANPGRWPELEGGNTTEEPPRRGSAEQVGSCENHNITQDPNMIEHAAALSTAVVLAWFARRALKLGLYGLAFAGVLYSAAVYSSLAAVGVATLALAIAMMTCSADSIPGRINAALTSAWWMLFAVFTAGAVLHRLGRRHLGASGIFASTARALLAAFVLTMLAAYGASIRAHGEPRHVSCGEVTDYPERHPHSHCFDDYKRPGESLLHAVKRFKRETKYDELIPCVTVLADPKRLSWLTLREGAAQMMLGRSPIMHAVSRLDPIRLKRLQRALREGMKPSRWYDDDPTDTKSLYRRRWLAGLDICRDIVQNSPDRDLVQFAEKALSDAREQLPLTFAAWEEDKG